MMRTAVGRDVATGPNVPPATTRCMPRRTAPKKAAAAIEVMLAPGRGMTTANWPHRGWGTAAGPMVGVSAGGDGTQALVAGIAAEHGLPFLVISAGTREPLRPDRDCRATRPPARCAHRGEQNRRHVDRDCQAIDVRQQLSEGSFGATSRGKRCAARRLPEDGQARAPSCSNAISTARPAQTATRRPAPAQPVDPDSGQRTHDQDRNRGRDQDTASRLRAHGWSFARTVATLSMVVMSKTQSTRQRDCLRQPQPVPAAVVPQSRIGLDGERHDRRLLR